MTIVVPSSLPAQGNPEVSGTNELTNQERMADVRVVWETAADWDLGNTTDTVASPHNPEWLALSDAESTQGRFPRTAQWISQEVTTEFPFTELLPSWNLMVPPQTGALLDVRVRVAETGEWSPWLYIGQWGKTTLPPWRKIAFEHGVVNVDVLQLEKAANTFQLRVRLQSFNLEDVAAAPALRRLTAVYSGRIEDDALLAQYRAVALDGEWAKSIPVPHFRQAENGRSIKGETCSPTSVSMVMQHYGIDIPVVENCLAIYDPEYDIFGNWGRGVARAGELGLDGWLERFRTWDQVKATIASGQPIIASIKFREGEMPSAPYDGTGGHLLVIRGLTPEGDLIINDPAVREGNGIVYKAEEMEKAWLAKGGVGYIITRLPHGMGAKDVLPAPGGR